MQSLRKTSNPNHFPRNPFGPSRTQRIHYSPNISLSKKILINPQISSSNKNIILIIQPLDYSHKIPSEDKIDFKAQQKILSINPFNPDQYLTLDCLLDFVLFDENNVAKINDDLQILKCDGHFTIIEEGQILCTIKDEIFLN